MRSSLIFAGLAAAASEACVPLTVTTTVTVRETATVGTGQNQGIASTLPGSASSAALPTASAPAACSEGTVFVTYTPTITVTASSAALSSSPITNSATTYSSSAVSSAIASTTKGSASSFPSITLSSSQAVPATSGIVTSSTAISIDSSVLSSSTSTANSVGTSKTSATSTAAATATASTASASSVTTPSGTPQLSSKRGILATAGDDQEALTVAFTNSPKISWLCNWYSAPPPNEAAHIQFVPQFYGSGGEAAYKEWNTNAKQAVTKGEKYFLSFGEPAQAGSTAYMTPQQAVDLFMQQMQPYAQEGVAIGSPSVLQPREQMDWLAQFLPLCEQAGCSISFVAVHWFDHTSASAPGFPEFRAAVENATALANGKPVWVDNFQANGTEPDVKAFFNEAIPYLESNQAVARYAYVSPMRTEPAAGFLNQDGSLSDLGAYYANFAS